LSVAADGSGIGKDQRMEIKRMKVSVVVYIAVFVVVLMMCE